MRMRLYGKCSMTVRLWDMHHGSPRHLTSPARSSSIMRLTCILPHFACCQQHITGISGPAHSNQDESGSILVIRLSAATAGGPLASVNVNLHVHVAFDLISISI